MISFDVRYLQPETLDEAAQAWQEEHAAGREPRYLAAGTELLTMARDNRLRPGAFIDLKRLPETTVLETDAVNELRYGACVTLNDAAEAAGFPLLSAACARVADHTVRNSITVGGNVCGMLPYREAVLPFLVGDGSAVIAGARTGAPTRAVPLDACFDKRLALEPGEFLVALTVPATAAAAPHWYRRRERDARVDYPLLTLCAARIDGAIRLAFAGVLGYPLRSRSAEEALASAAGTARDRAEAFVRALPGEPRSDMRASGEYRRELLVQAVADAITELEGGS
ncbi:MAG: xanthine dehydrogenase [Spirochaetaceae bacterium]|nr:MAG: xanthine dehydrogenase [Spirochaetaceae bacterium]